MEFVKVVRKIIKTKRTLKAADVDVHLGNDANIDPYMLAGVTEGAVEVWIQGADEKWIKTLLFPPKYPKTVGLDQYDHVTSFPYATLIQRNHRAHFFLSEKGCFTPAIWFGKQ